MFGDLDIVDGYVLGVCLPVGRQGIGLLEFIWADLTENKKYGQKNLAQNECRWLYPLRDLYGGLPGFASHTTFSGS